MMKKGDAIKNLMPADFKGFFSGSLLLMLVIFLLLVDAGLFF
jgi:hypothetical protein